MQIIPLRNPEYILSRFCLCGISYQKTDAATRGLFHINNETKVTLLNTAKRKRDPQLFYFEHL